MPLEMVIFWSVLAYHPLQRYIGHSQGAVLSATLSRASIFTTLHSLSPGLHGWGTTVRSVDDNNCLSSPHHFLLIRSNYDPVSAMECVYIYTGHHILTVRALFYTPSITEDQLLAHVLSRTKITHLPNNAMHLLSIHLWQDYNWQLMFFNCESRSSSSSNSLFVFS